MTGRSAAPAISRRALLVSLCSLSFLCIYSGTVLAPLLTLVSDEFGTTVGLVGIGAALYGVAAIPMALVLGPLSERVGRKPFLVGGALLIGVFGLLSVVAPSFAIFAIARTISGFGSMMIFGMLHASVADVFPYSERGSAQGMVVFVNQLAPILAVPIAGFIAEASSWRWSVAMPSILALGVAAVAARQLPDLRVTRAGQAVGYRAAFREALGNPGVRLALVAFFFTQTSWLGWLPFLVVFIERTYGLSPAGAASVAIASGLGVAVGSIVGGRLGDRFGNRPVALPASLALAALFVVLTAAPLPLWLGTLLIFAIAAFVSARFVATSVLLVGQAPAVRGTVGALMSSVQGIAMAGAALVGAYFVDRGGFPAFGIFLALTCLGAAAAMARLREQRDAVAVA